MAAIELIHKQPVRWTNTKVVSCDGGGGPLGHPKIFINTDKPEIATCGYCGLPFVRPPYLFSMIYLCANFCRPTSITVPISSRCPQPATPSSLPATLQK